LKFESTGLFFSTFGLNVLRWWKCDFNALPLLSVSLLHVPLAHKRTAHRQQATRYVQQREIHILFCFKSSAGAWRTHHAHPCRAASSEQTFQWQRVYFLGKLPKIGSVSEHLIQEISVEEK
jgi:hypothetical protein